MNRRDPYRVTVAALIVIALAGLVAIGLAYRSIHHETDVAFQLPYVVSGVMGGIALSGFCLGLLAVQTTRRREATERAEFARVVRAAAELLAATRSGL